MGKFIISGFADEIAKDFNEQMAHLESLGIQFFEIRNVDGENISKLSDEAIARVKQIINEKGIKVSAIGSPVGKDSIEEDFSLQLARFHRIIEIAKMLETSYIRIFSYHTGIENKDEVIFRLKEFVKIAEENQIILLHENEKGIFGDSAENCKYLFDNIVSPNFKGIFDPANFIQCGVETYPFAYQLLKEHIVYMHIKDADADGTVVPAGTGVGKLKEILTDLSDNQYEGFLSLEPHLGNFAGFSDLGDETTKMLCESDSGKFTLAYNSLMKILKEIK